MFSPIEEKRQGASGIHRSKVLAPTRARECLVRPNADNIANESRLSMPFAHLDGAEGWPNLAPPDRLFLTNLFIWNRTHPVYQ